MKKAAKIKDSKSYWLGLKKAGWLDHVPESEHDQLRLSIEAAIKESGNDFAYLGLCSFSFDYECIFDDDSYPALFAAFAEYSRGEFKPEKARSKRDPKNKG